MLFLAVCFMCRRVSLIKKNHLLNFEACQLVYFKDNI